MDGSVEKAAIRGHYPARIAHFFFSSRTLRLPQCVWDGESYTELRGNAGQEANRLETVVPGAPSRHVRFPKIDAVSEEDERRAVKQDGRLNARGSTTWGNFCPWEIGFVLVAKQSGSILPEAKVRRSQRNNIRSCKMPVRGILLSSMLVRGQAANAESAFPTK